MMYRARPGLVIGFHGCDNSTKNAVVLNETSLYPSQNEYDWLGHGIYFWENNQKRAIQFAEELKKQDRKGKQPIIQAAAIGAVIDLGYCLDLMDSTCLELIRDSYEKLVWAYEGLGMKLPENKCTYYSKERLIRKLDCAVIENHHRMREEKLLEPFDTVRSLFIEGDELYPTAGFNEKNHIQICVRNPNCIKAYFTPREEDPKWRIP